MEINIELSLFQLKRLETALAVLSYKQKHAAGSVNAEILKKELICFLKECPSILGFRENRRKNIQDILAWLKSKRNLEKDLWNHKIIQEVLIKLLEN